MYVCTIINCLHQCLLCFTTILFCDQDTFSNQIVKQEHGIWLLEKINKPHGNRARVGNLGPSGVERPRRLNLTKSDFEMPDKLDIRPSGSDLHHLFSNGYGTMPGDTAEDDMPVHHTRMISDMNDAEGCFLPKQISSETTVADNIIIVDAKIHLCGGR